MARQCVESGKGTGTTFALEGLESDVQLHVPLTVVLARKAWDWKSQPNFPVTGLHVSRSSLTLGAAFKGAFERPLLVVRPEVTLEIEMPERGEVRQVHFRYTRPPTW